jgi:plastocyanin
MTWLWRIFFSLCLALPALAGTVEGGLGLLNSTDPEVRRHLNYSGVVVWLESLSQVAPPRPDPTVHGLMAQKLKAFVPHVLAIPAGTSVDFPNFDPIFHNAFSSFSGQVFDVGLYPPGRSRTVTFKREGVVRVFCNIHSTMSAVIVVLNTPWFAVSDKAGHFSIPDVAPGTYLLHVYHERALPQTLDALTQTVKVSGGKLELPALSISETGFVQAPHLNKHGMDYPAGGHMLYSGEKK